MIWKKQQSAVFLFVVPYTGQKLINITAYKIDKEKPRRLIRLTDPDTGEPYKAEILDFFGPYDIDNAPDHLAAFIGGAAMSGKLLGYFLKKRKSEFSNCKKIIIYQANPI